jgi:hypothetical protein
MSTSASVKMAARKLHSREALIPRMVTQTSTTKEAASSGSRVRPVL